MDVSALSVGLSQSTQATANIGRRPPTEPPRVQRIERSGRLAGIFDDACGHLFQIKCARPLQDHLGDLTLAFANMAPQPGRNVGRLLRCKGCRRPASGNCADEKKVPNKVRGSNGTSPSSLTLSRFS